MKSTADQYYCVYFCVFEEPAMFKPLSYSSVFVSIRQPFVLSTDNASFKAKNIRAGSPDLFMSMVTECGNTEQVGILSEHALTLTRNRPRIIGQIQYGGARKECFCKVICHKTTF